MRLSIRTRIPFLQLELEEDATLATYYALLRADDEEMEERYGGR